MAQNRQITITESITGGDAAAAEARHSGSELGAQSLGTPGTPGVAIVRQPEPSAFHEFITDSSVFVPSVAFTFVTIAVVMGAITKIVATQARERTRREIAAYVAEGTMTPEQGERLLRSKVKDC